MKLKINLGILLMLVALNSNAQKAQPDYGLYTNVVEVPDSGSLKNDYHFDILICTNISNQAMDVRLYRRTKDGVSISSKYDLSPGEKFESNGCSWCLKDYVVYVRRAGDKSKEFPKKEEIGSYEWRNKN